MTDDVPNTTRDALAAPCEFDGVRFELIDAAGFLSSPDDSLQENIIRGLDAAVAAADLILLLFDGRDGLMPLDGELADFVRRLGKPVLPVVNKIDGPSRDSDASEFYELGFARLPLAVSAKGGYNCLELLAAVVRELGSGAGVARAAGDARLRVAIVGRPNVGKSSLLNNLAGAERVVVHEKPGTTRDAVDVEIESDDQRFVFVDTAGIRRRARAKERLEEWALAKAFAAVRRATAVVLVIDGAEGPTSQDAKIAGYTCRYGRALLIFVNKTDLLGGGQAAVEGRLGDVRRELKFADYAPVLCGSARAGFDVGPFYATLREIDENFRRRIGTGELNRFVRDALTARTFRAAGKEIIVRYAVQVAAAPPAFHLFLNIKKVPPPSFRRFVENRIRESFPFVGTPVDIVYRRRNERVAK